MLGPLSDAWGRRRLLLGATVVCAVALLFCALAPSAAVLTALRFVQGFSGGGGIVLARAVAADLTSGVAAARLFSLFMTLSSVAPIVAPVIGGALLVWTGSWPVMFYLLAAVNAALAAAIWVLVPESLPAEQRHTGGLRQTGRAFRDLLRDRVFLGYALTVAFAYASLFGYISGSSFALQEHYGLSATQFSAVFALNAAGMVVLGLLNARLVRRFPVRRLLVVGLVGSSVAAGVRVLAVTAGAPLGVLAVLPPLFVVVTTRGLVSSNATVLRGGTGFIGRRLGVRSARGLHVRRWRARDAAGRTRAGGLARAHGAGGGRWGCRGGAGHRAAHAVPRRHAGGRAFGDVRALSAPPLAGNLPGPRRRPTGSAARKREDGWTSR